MALVIAIVQSVIKMFDHSPKENDQNLTAQAKGMIRNVRIADEISFALVPPTTTGWFTWSLARQHPDSAPMRMA